jgi:hypothetical protein
MEARNRTRIAQIKLQAGCMDCGYDDHPAALSFDHVQGQKMGNVSELIKRSWAVIMGEIQKCDVVCLNCHAVRTWSRAVAA